MRASVLAAVLVVTPAAFAQSIAGLWDATVVVNELEIPFRFEISGAGPDVQGSFFNGDEKVSSSAGRFENGLLSLTFDHYATKLEATWKDGRLEGTYIRGARGGYPFRATRLPQISGEWEIGVKSPKGESAWRFIVRQSGRDVSATILRVDGDTGTLTGAWRDGKFVLSHFSGARPSLLEIKPASDGTLLLTLNGKTSYTAVRQADARAKGLAGPTDPTRHTSVKDPKEPFRFSFPDLDGRMVSERDARFQGKVVVVNILGSWCPNCHDEAPFLVELYRTYRARGLEVVGLSFEDVEQLKDPARLRAFIRHYGIEFPVLLAGEPSEAAAKLPQMENFNAWPTTFFLGRDGRVRYVHVGFAGAATGEAHQLGKREIKSVVERLLE